MSFLIWVGAKEQFQSAYYWFFSISLPNKSDFKKGCLKCNIGSQTDFCIIEMILGPQNWQDSFQAGISGL